VAVPVTAASLSDTAVYLLVAVMVFKEGTALLRFGLPGELAAIFGGVMASGAMASRFDVSLGRMLVVVLASAIISDGIAHQVGHFTGPSTLGYRVLVVRRERLLAAHRSLVRRPHSAMVLSRFTLFGRRVLPPLAGAVGIPYRRFLPWNALGNIVWSCAFVTVGNFLGYLDHDVVTATAAAFLLGVVLAVVADAALWRLKSEAGRND
jgi:membrane-associated protein